MRILSKIQLAVCLFIATAWADYNIQTGTIVDWGTQNVGLGDVNIAAGAIWSIINNAASDFHGNINVGQNGGLYVSAVDPSITLSATLYDSIYGVVNNGVISFNAIKGYSNYIFIIMGNKLLNNGDLFYSASGEGSTVSSIKSTDWTNNGFIQFYQEMKSDSYVYLGMDGKTMLNNGQICFTNQNWYQLTGLLGKGCITAQAQSSFYFINTNLQISEDQIFYLTTGDSSIMAIGSTNDPRTFHVRGFGTTNGVANKIGLSATLSSPTPGKSPFAYNARDGTLTLYVGLYTQIFEIGTGYDYTQFEIVSDTSRGIPQIYLGAVQYNGPPPNPGMPPECKQCKGVPGIPGIDKPPATSYSVQTSEVPTSSASIFTPSSTPVATKTSAGKSSATDKPTATHKPHIKTVTVFVTATVTDTEYVTETDYVK
ncbi:hypothetical protein I9W82_003177 [Candida metapsilosis]|uniref:Hyphally-regulated cell wall protein N-terminal domain-containing protein n=1 Tax=Candida metapsilosis TaxID=273372 RepID=A0A8H7ZCP1_9ASCO|nr:hypothetical protein I9W82_003177 [Candida metapsilosis]